MPNRFLDTLNRIYPEHDTQSLLKSLHTLRKRYETHIASTPYTLSERDVVLIAYGDHITKPNTPPLKSLNTFLLDHLKGVINTVHILPFFPYSSDDGFSVIDYYQVSPSLGGWEEIQTIAKNHRLMIDGVLNHISQHSSWFQGFLADLPSYQDYFIEVDSSIDIKGVIRPRTTPLVHTYRDHKGSLRSLWTTFSQDQIDLNYHNPEVLLQMLDVLLFYLSKGAKLIRLDAIAFLWKEQNTSCVHLPKTHTLIQLIREVIHDIAPEVLLITETNVPHHENIAYFGSGYNEAQMVYNFALPPLLAHGILREDARFIQQWANTLTLPSDEVCFFNFTASHDGVGVRPIQEILPKTEVDYLLQCAINHGGEISYRQEKKQDVPYEINCSYIDLLSSPDEDNKLRIKRLLLSQAIALAMPGVPAIYINSLIGFGNDYERVKRTGNKRAINRQKFLWEDLESLLCCENSPNHILFKQLTQLIEIRTHEQAFHPFGSFTFPELHPQIFAIERIAPEKKRSVLSLHNLTSHTLTLSIPKAYHGSNDLIHHHTLGGTLTLKPYDFSWLRSSFGGEGGASTP